MNKGSMWGKIVYVGWRFGAQNGLVDVPFRPVVLDEFPPPVSADEAKSAEASKSSPTSSSSYKLPPSVGHFCFPQHVGIVRSDVTPIPTWFTFVLTDENAGQIFGSCLKFFEEMNEEEVMELEALKMAYEIGRRSKQRLPTEEELERMIDDAIVEQAKQRCVLPGGSEESVEDRPY